MIGRQNLLLLLTAPFFLVALAQCQYDSEDGPLVQFARERSFCVVDASASAPRPNIAKADRPLLVFVHVNKGGGSFIRSLLNFYARHTGLKYSGTDIHQDMLYARGLTPDDLKLLDDVDIVNGAWGYCGLVDRPCVYLSHVRDPVEMCLSHYRYFCKLGKEGRDMWAPDWTSCDLSIGDWFGHCCHHEAGRNLNMVSYKYARAAGSVNNTSGCLRAEKTPSLAAASHNLLSKCTRYIVSKNSPDEIPRVLSLLKQVFPWTSFDLPDSFTATDNSTPKDTEVDTDENLHWCQDNVIQDKIFYSLAELQYEDTWKSPLHFC